MNFIHIMLCALTVNFCLSQETPLKVQISDIIQGVSSVKDFPPDLSNIALSYLKPGYMEEIANIKTCKYTKDLRTITSFAWSPDGEYLAYANKHSNAETWCKNTNEIRMLETGNYLYWYGASKLFVVHSWGWIHLEDLEDKNKTIYNLGKSIRRYENNVAFSPVSKRALLVRDKIHLEVATVEENKINVKSLYTHNNEINNIAVSPNEKRIAFISGGGVFIISNKKVVSVVGYGFVKNDILSWLPDSSKIVIAQDKKILVFDLKTNKYWEHDTNCSVSCCAVSPDGNFIAYNYYSFKKGWSGVKIWDLQNDQLLLEKLDGFKKFDKVTCLAWSPDGKMLAAGSDFGIVKIWGRTLG